MEHIHGSYESENLFKISPFTREIINKSEIEIVITQCDHHSERFIFELPKIVDEHDMTLCSAIRVHYINIGTNGTHNKGVYDITDLKVNEDDDEIVNFSWLISKNATSLNGSLNFAIQFICETDGKIDYAWSTVPYKQIKITETYDNSDDVIDEEVYEDILSQWKEELYAELEKNIDFTNYYNKDQIQKLLSEKSNCKYIQYDELDTYEAISTDTVYFYERVDYVNAPFEAALIYNSHDSYGTLSIPPVYQTAIASDGLVYTRKLMGLADFGETEYDFSTPWVRSTAKASDVFTKTEIGALLSETANAFVKMESGKVVRVDDVSPISHTAKAEVSGKNLVFYPYNVTTREESGITFTDNGDGTITVNGTATEHSTFLAIWYPSLLPIKAGVYTISGCPVGGGSNTYELVVGWRKNPTDTRVLHYEQGNGLTCEFEDGYLDLICVVRKGTTVDNVTFKPQIEMGDTATEYEPYVDPSTVTVTACGKNFWRSKLSYPRTVSGVTVNYDPETQIYTFNGTSTAAGDIYTMPNNTYIMRINPGETWTLKVEVMGGDIDGEATSSGKISPLVNTTSYTNTLHANAESLYVTKTYSEVADITKMYFYVYAAGLVFNNFKIRVQLEMNDKPTEFEKFKKFTNYTPTSEGDVEIASIYPTMTVLTDADGVNVELTYNQDSNKAMENVNKDIRILDSDMTVLKETMGNFETVLDELHNYAQALIGGEA